MTFFLYWRGEGEGGLLLDLVVSFLAILIGRKFKSSHFEFIFVIPTKDKSKQMFLFYSKSLFLGRIKTVFNNFFKTWLNMITEGGGAS